LVGIKRAAGEKAALDFDGRHLAETVVDAQDEFFRVLYLVDIHLAEFDSALPQELFRAAAIAAPPRSVDRYFVHFSLANRVDSVQVDLIMLPLI